MPVPLLNAHAEKLPRLVAEESLREAERIAVGSGSLKKGVGSRITSGWLRQADQHRPAVRATSKAVYRATMAGLGIGVKPTKVQRDG